MPRRARGNPTWKFILFQLEMFRRALWELRLMDGMEMLKSAVKPGGSDTPPGARGVGLGPEKIQPPELTLHCGSRCRTSAGCWLVRRAQQRGACLQHCDTLQCMFQQCRSSQRMGRVPATHQVRSTVGSAGLGW